MAGQLLYAAYALVGAKGNDDDDGDDDDDDDCVCVYLRKAANHS